MIASVKLPNDDAQVDASRYDSERGGTASVCVGVCVCNTVEQVASLAFLAYHCMVHDIVWCINAPKTWIKSR